ncbi:MAG: hypothetical protein ACFFB2_09010 [Promethearchaeota archaeon]
MVDHQNESSVVICRGSFKDCPELYSFHENMPKFKFIDTPKDTNDSHPVRPAIMAILREGVIDAGTNDNEKPRQRYALNAREIKNLLGKNRNSKISKISYTNLYFHLNTLKDVGHIKVVAEVIERNHRIAYYGRTARVILISDSEAEKQKYKKIFGELGKLAKTLQPGIKIEGLRTLHKDFQAYKYTKTKEMALWLAENEEVIRKEKLDISLLFNGLKVLDTLDPEYRILLDILIRIFPKELTQV